MRGFQFVVRTKDDLTQAIQDFGIVPLFANRIPGFSVEEHVSPDVWFSGDEGVWEWKGPIIRETGCAYGKFLENKAVFISKEWFPDFANFRRDGYDFDARFDDGLASFRDRELFDLVSGNAPILSKVLKAKGNYRPGGRKGFDTIISRLQAQCYVLISDFVYERDRFGSTYGWGVAEYSTPERFMGRSFTGKVYRKKPDESYQRILKQLQKLLPDIDDSKLKKLLRG